MLSGDGVYVLDSPFLAMPAGYGYLRYTADPDDMIKYGCTLLGIYFFVTGVASLSSLPQTIWHYDTDLHAFLASDDWLIIALFIFGATALLSLLPAFLLVYFAPSIAERFGDAGAKPEISETGLYSVLALALAAYFFVSGFGSLAIGLVQLIPDLFSGSMEHAGLRFGLGPTISGAVQMISAGILYRHSLRVARSQS